MSITGAARPRPDARRHPDRRPDRRQPAGARHHDGALRPRAHRRRPLGRPASLLEAQVFMLDFQATRWLMAKRGRAAGRQRPPDRHPDRRVPDQRRPHQHRGQFRRACSERFCEAIERPEWKRKRGMEDPEGRSSGPQGDQRGDRRDHPARSRRSTGSSCWRAPAFRAGRSTRSTRCSPIRRCSISAWRRRWHSPVGDIKEVVASAINITGFSKAIRKADAGDSASDTDEVLAIGRLQRRRDRRHAQEGSDLIWTRYQAAASPANTPAARCWRRRTTASG